MDDIHKRTAPCPVCGKDRVFGRVAAMRMAVANGSVCKKCSANSPNAIAVRKANGARVFLGKKHSDVSKKLIGLASIARGAGAKAGKLHPMYGRTGEKNPMSGKTVYDIWLMKHGKEEADKRNEEASVRKSIASRGSNNSMYGKPAPHGSGGGWSGWYKDWFFRSLLELSYVIGVLEKEGHKWISLDTDFRYKIQYEFGGVVRTYRADFLVDDKIMVEVKPLRLMNTPQNIAKRKAAEKFCNKHGFEYRVVDIRLLDTTMIKQLWTDKIIKFSSKWEKRMVDNVCSPVNLDC